MGEAMYGGGERTQPIVVELRPRVRGRSDAQLDRSVRVLAPTRCDAPSRARVRAERGGPGIEPQGGATSWSGRDRRAGERGPGRVLDN